MSSVSEVRIVLMGDSPRFWGLNIQVHTKREDSHLGESDAAWSSNKCVTFCTAFWAEVEQDYKSFNSNWKSFSVTLSRDIINDDIPCESSSSVMLSDGLQSLAHWLKCMQTRSPFVLVNSYSQVSLVTFTVSLLCLRMPVMKVNFNLPLQWTQNIVLLFVSLNFNCFFQTDVKLSQKLSFFHLQPLSSLSKQFTPKQFSVLDYIVSLAEKLTNAKWLS